ncbi:MAG: LacI family DNA-binding transcriptional regulator [Lacipirellulaceae bacterium]
MADRSPRLKDVAELANVSLSAASRILRGDDGRFGEETCRRVREASQKLGWRRNLLVSGMQTGRTRTIGVMIPPHDSFWVSVLTGIHAKFAEADYLPITVWLGDLEHMPLFDAPEEEGLRLINRMLDRRVEGFILWPPFGMAYAHHFPELRDHTVPVVMIDHHTDRPISDTVATNEEHATRLVARHLIDLGHRRIGFVSSPEAPSKTWAVERQGHFAKAIDTLGGGRLVVARVGPEGTDELVVVRKLLSGPGRPTAVFAATDHEAACVYRAAAELGLRIPHDLSVVGFADLDFATALSPQLTTVRQRPREIGARAATLVLERIAKQAAGSPYVDARVEADLVLRESTAPAAEVAS